MSRIHSLKPVFTDKIPEDLAPGILYISMNHRIAKHFCPCGCGEVITIIFDPELWKLKYDGESVSVFPSIGNYHIPCQSHYFITDNQVNWCEIKEGQKLYSPFQRLIEKNKRKRKRERFFNIVSRGLGQPHKTLVKGRVSQIVATKVTSKKVATQASKALQDGRSSARTKSIAGSALSQREKPSKKE